MKKIILSLVFIFSLITSVSANYYYSNSIESFISSPSKAELASIEDSDIAYCEQVFLEAYMRRDFTETENQKCSDIFEMKIEAQMNYMRYVMGQRGIY